MAKVKVYISCHKPSKVQNTEVFKPIQLGCALNDFRLDNMLHDDEGENISNLNHMYCELTAQYWTWKNEENDYYGFCHYRRYFNFSETEYGEDPYGNIIESYITDKSLKKYGIADKEVLKLVSNYDVIITERKDISLMPEKYESIYDHYARATLLHKKDMDTLIEIIEEKYPEYAKYAHEHLEGHVTSFCNMYILRKDIFFCYCEWMFSVLEEFCKRTDMKYYSTEALRTPGHLSERLFGIFYLKLLHDNPLLRVKELQCVLFEHTDDETKIDFKGNENVVPIVFAANRHFAPMFATCFKSLLEHISSEYFYEVFLLHNDLQKEEMHKLQEMVQGYENCSLSFYNVGPLIVDYNLSANAHITVETYYRFLIQEVLPRYKKVLYLDADIIIQADVADLYCTDVKGYMLAAVRDVDFLGQINGADKETQKYVSSEFHMRNPYNYFQAGVILFNEEEMRKAHSLDEWLKLASHPYKYNDQDVLNLSCEGRVKYLDMSWNLITDCDHYRIKNVVVHAPDAVQKEYFAARKAPKIIHYAGFMKPWYRPSEDFGNLFWEYARRTPFYEELIFRMAEGITYWQIYELKKDLKLKKMFKHGFEGLKLELSAKNRLFSWMLRK